MSQFDPKTFAQMTFDQANSTKVTPVPAGDQPATLSRYEIAAWSSREDPTKNGLKMNVFFDCDSADVKEHTKRDTNIVRYEFFLDTNEVGLDFGEGKNVKLGRLREALDLNTPGVPFTFDMMVGRRALVRVAHRATDTGDLVAEVKSLAKLA